MHKLITLFFFCVIFSGFAQTPQVTLALQNVTMNAGGQASANINITSATAASVAGIQFNLTYPSTLSNVTVTAGAVATAASKTLQCNNPINPTICIIYGMNQNIIADGVLATVSFKVSTTALNFASSFAAQQLVLSCSLVVASTPSGSSLTTVGANNTIAVFNQYDLTQDGKVDITDITAFVPQIFGTVSCTNDFNVDNVCNVVDVLMIIQAALGLIH